jgi:hypothetical protein
LDTGEWADQDTCPGDCDSGVCVGACTANTTQCAGDSENPVQITCNGTSWETSPTTECDFVCEEATGTCGGECVPHEPACASANTIEVCEITGYYGEPTPCDYICDQSENKCAGECVPGTKRCNSTSIETCGDDGKWAVASTCTGSEAICLEATQGEPKCVACAPGAKKCAASANQVLTCAADGSWPETGTTCKTVKPTGATVCWKGACEDTDEVCPSSTCGKACPRGCGDADTRWYCAGLIGASTFTTADCASGLACTSGVCE